MDNFAGIKHLNPDEGNWGDASKIDATLLQMVDQLATYLDTKIFVTSGYRPQSDGSQHQLGKALDIMVPEYEGTLLQFYQAAEALGFPGLGVYPRWRYNGQAIGGLHVDVRDTPNQHARWMGVPTSKPGGQVYIGLTPENLKTWGVA